jgi:peptide/nickel transport system permease protein
LKNKICKKLFRRKIAIFCFGIILLFCFLAIFASFIAPFDPNEINLTNQFASPSRFNLLGTDEYGRDIFSRIIFGARVSIFVGLIATFISVFIGVFLGILAGYFGGIIDYIISRISEIFYAFPDVLFAIVIMFVLGPGITNLLIALGVLGWVGTARLIRAQVLELKQKEFVRTFKASGFGDFYIMFKVILPNCISILIVTITTLIPSSIMSEAALSFLGLGVMPPTASWGNMISSARIYIKTVPSYSIFSGLSIVLLVLAFNIFGDALRDAIDPNIKIM